MESQLNSAGNRGENDVSIAETGVSGSKENSLLYGVEVNCWTKGRPTRRKKILPSRGGFRARRTTTALGGQNQSGRCKKTSAPLTIPSNSETLPGVIATKSHRHAREGTGKGPEKALNQTKKKRPHPKNSEGHTLPPRGEKKNSRRSGFIMHQGHTKNSRGPCP